MNLYTRSICHVSNQKKCICIFLHVCVLGGFDFAPVNTIFSIRFLELLRDIVVHFVFIFVTAVVLLMNISSTTYRTDLKLEEKNKLALYFAVHTIHAIIFQPPITVSLFLYRLEDLQNIHVSNLSDMPCHLGHFSSWSSYQVCQRCRRLLTDIYLNMTGSQYTIIIRILETVSHFLEETIQKYYHVILHCERLNQK